MNWPIMTNVPVVITFLTIFAQLQYGLGIDWNRYSVPGPSMSRISTLSRPSLSSPSGAFTLGDIPKADLPKPSYLPSRGARPINQAGDPPVPGLMGRVLMDPDFEAVRRRHNELTSGMKSMVLGGNFPDNPDDFHSAVESMMGDFPGQGISQTTFTTKTNNGPPVSRTITRTFSGPLQRVPSIGRTPSFTEPLTGSLIKPPSEPQPEAPLTPSSGYWRNNPMRLGGGVSQTPPATPSPPPVPEPVPDPPSVPLEPRPPLRRPSFGRSPTITEPPSQPQPEAPLPSSSWSTNPMKLGGSGSQTLSPTPSPPSPPACAADNSRLSISQYRRQPSLSKSGLNGPDEEAKPAKVEPTPPVSPSPKPQPTSLYKPPTTQPPATPQRFGNTGNLQPSNNSGSSSNKRYGGSTTVSEELPKKMGTIDIKISGSQIDDERMHQMIKEAKNAITAVFHAPLYDSNQLGKIAFKELPQSTGFEF